MLVLHTWHRYRHESLKASPRILRRDNTSEAPVAIFDTLMEALLPIDMIKPSQDTDTVSGEGDEPEVVVAFERVSSTSDLIPDKII